MAYPRRYTSISFGGPLTPAVKWLMVACVAVFILQQASRIFVALFALQPWLVWQGFLWQLVSYIFLHASPWHLAGNMLMLFMFGCQIERYWGWRRFLFYFLLTGAGGGITIALAGLWVPALIVVGASASIFGVIIAWALMFPDAQAYMIPFPVPIRAKWFALISIGIEMLIVWSASPSLWGSVAHLGGAATGYLYLKKPRGMPRFRGAYTRWRNRRIARKFRVVVNDDLRSYLDDDHNKLVN